MASLATPASKMATPHLDAPFTIFALKKKTIHLFEYACLHASSCVLLPSTSAEDNLHGSFLSVYHVGSTDQIGFDRGRTNVPHHHLVSPVLFLKSHNNF